MNKEPWLCKCCDHVHKYFGVCMNVKCTCLCVYEHADYEYVRAFMFANLSCMTYLC